MRSRPLILGLLLVYQSLFLNVFLPGHTRGAITLDGTKTATASRCCCRGGGETHTPAEGRRPAVPSQKDCEHCAVCSFAARVTTPAVIVLWQPSLGLLERRPPSVPAAVTSVERIRTYLACGPPPVCA